MIPTEPPLQDLPFGSIFNLRLNSPGNLNRTKEDSFKAQRQPDPAHSFFKQLRLLAIAKPAVPTAVRQPSIEVPAEEIQSHLLVVIKVESAIQA